MKYPDWTVCIAMLCCVGFARQIHDVSVTCTCCLFIKRLSMLWRLSVDVVNRLLLRGILFWCIGEQMLHYIMCNLMLHCVTSYYAATTYTKLQQGRRGGSGQDNFFFSFNHPFLNVCSIKHVVHECEFVLL